MKNVLNKPLIAAILPLSILMAGCQESLEDRCAREAREYTQKKCPAPIDENTTIDSVSFDKETKTMKYYYTIGGAADNEEIIRKVNPRKALLDGIKNSTAIQAYKEAHYNFAYTYRSKKDKGKLLYETTFTAQDYTKK